MPYIYEQGRTVPYRDLLSPLDEDTAVGGLYPAWSVHVPSTLVLEHALIAVRSNRWPGAFAVGDRSRFKNVYIGWGMKNSDECRPANTIHLLPSREFDVPLLEVNDPTVDEENDLLRSSILLSPSEDEDFEDSIE